MKATPTKGQNVTSEGHSAALLEQRMSDAALTEGERRYPSHTDKQMARDADCSLDAMKKARARGKLRLRYVMMLARTWGPDAWAAISEPVDQRLATCLRIEAWAEEQISHRSTINKPETILETPSA